MSTRSYVLLAALLVILAMASTELVRRTYLRLMTSQLDAIQTTVESTEPALKISITSGPARVTTEPYREQACKALLAGEFDHFWIELPGNHLEFVKAENCASSAKRLNP